MSCASVGVSSSSSLEPLANAPAAFLDLLFFFLTSSSLLLLFLFWSLLVLFYFPSNAVHFCLLFLCCSWGLGSAKKMLSYLAFSQLGFSTMDRSFSTGVSLLMGLEITHLGLGLIALLVGRADCAALPTVGMLR